MVIGSFWIGHHSKFRLINRYDGTLLLLNLLMLMVIAFMPFPTAVLSQSGNRTATIFYALTMVVAGLLSTLMWWHAAHGNRLIPADLGRAQRQRGFLSPIIVPAIFLLSIGIAFINDDAAKLSWLLIAPAARYLR
jgi:TMEM175 potassium channel family protein